MLKIIKGGFSSNAHEKIKKEITELVQKEKPCILIVPEQQTLLAEAEMTDILPQNAPLFFEATNFTRLANITARALGGISGEYCDNTKKALLMWRALTELTPILSTDGAFSVNEGSVKRYLSASGRLDALGIGAEELAAAAKLENLKDNRLKKKLTDLSAVHSLYKKLLLEKYGDSEDECRKMLDKLRANPRFLSERKIFIEGFISFTETQYALIRELAKRSEVTVLLYISHASGDSFEYTEVRGTLDRLKKEGRLSGDDIRISTEDSRSQKTEDISLICDLLWRSNHGYDNITLQNPNSLRIFEAETPFDECEFIASDIKRKVMEGASYSDFAIVARSADKYKGILDSALALSGIPAFFSKQNELSGLEAIKLIYSAYAVLRSGFARENLISYAKCALAGIDRDECDELEYYTEKWQITGARFTNGELWNMNPEGYTAKWKDESRERVLKINRVRDRLVSPLLSFADETKEAATVKEQAEALISHLTSIGVYEALMQRSELLLSLGEYAAAEDTRRMWKTLCEALDSLVEVSGELPSDRESFASMLKICFGNLEISRLPAYVDQVTVGSADMIRLYDKKEVYLIGVNAGEFPANVSDNSYFTEADKTLLSSLGLNLSPELEAMGARELYLFARAMTYAKEAVTLSYTLRDTKYKARERSDVINKIIKLTGESLLPIKISSLSAAERIWDPKCAAVAMSEIPTAEKEAVKEALCRSGHQKTVDICGESITNEDLSFNGSLARKSGQNTLSLTQSRIDSFANCPLGHFCRYTLNLTSEEKAEFDSRNIGTFIHAILENVFRELSENKKDTSTLTKEEKIDLTHRAAKKYLGEMGENVSSASERTKIKINRLVRAALPVVDGLCEEFATSKFKPKFFELAITRQDENSPEPVTVTSNDGNEVFVYGFIDRVDTYEKDGDVYIRIVDYKTGAKSFSPTDPAEGKNLQMFLYLKSILDSDKKSFLDKLGVNGGRVIPAGVIYVKAAINDTRVELPDDTLAEEKVKSMQKREGMVLDDEDIISAMGAEFTPVYNAKKPNVIPEAKRKFLFTEESLNGIINDSLTVTANIADQIAKGNVKAVPRLHDGKKTFCDSCEYKPICRKAVIT